MHRWRALYVIDGYNVLFAWEEFAALAKINLDSAPGGAAGCAAELSGLQKDRHAGSV